MVGEEEVYMRVYDGDGYDGDVDEEDEEGVEGEVETVMVVEMGEHDVEDVNEKEEMGMEGGVEVEMGRHGEEVEVVERWGMEDMDV